MAFFGLFGKKMDPVAPPVPTVKTTVTSATTATMINVTLANAAVDPNAFAGYTPLPGLENLGRHITDASGAPSGSPANFENLRGARTADNAPSKQTIDVTITKLLKEFGRG